jgi:hypothetical protein
MGLVNKTISVFVPKDAAARKIAKKTKLRVPKVAYCCFSMGQISPFYGVKQLIVS